MGEMRENIFGSEPFKALGSHSRVSDMLHGMLELSARPPSLYVLYVRWWCCGWYSVRVRTVPVRRRVGQPHGLWCVGIKNELNATKGPALLQPRRRRVLRAGDEGRGVSGVNPGWPWRAEGERKRGVDMSAQRVHMQAPNRGGYPIWVR